MAIIRQGQSNIRVKVTNIRTGKARQRSYKSNETDPDKILDKFEALEAAK